MKKLKKFQKFALSAEQASKVKGGMMAICGSGADAYLIASDSWEALGDFAGEQDVSCAFIR